MAKAVKKKIAKKTSNIKRVVKKIARKPKAVTPRKSKDIPVTHEMLLELREELKHGLNSNKIEIKALSKKMDGRFKDVDARFDKVDARFKEVDARFDKVDARFKEVDARFKEVDARFKEIDARFDKVDARFNTMDSKFEKVLSEIHRVGLLVEEQNSRNKFVLDGYTSLNDRIEAQENEINSIKKTIDSF